MSATPARFLGRAAPADHFRGVTKMVGQTVTQRNPAAGFYQRSSSQGFLDYSNRRRSRVTEESSVTAADGKAYTTKLCNTLDQPAWALPFLTATHFRIKMFL